VMHGLHSAYRQSIMPLTRSICTQPTRPCRHQSWSNTTLHMGCGQAYVKYQSIMPFTRSLCTKQTIKQKRYRRRSEAE
jgi:hypothetical protein